MSLSDEEIEFAVDLFADLGPVTTRKMFGGLGLYLDGTIFALMRREGTLQLKGVGAMVDVFNDAGWAQWTYEGKGGKIRSMPYWEVPDDLRDDPDAACAWARRAISHL